MSHEIEICSAVRVPNIPVLSGCNDSAVATQNYSRRELQIFIACTKTSRYSVFDTACKNAVQAVESGEEVTKGAGESAVAVASREQSHRARAAFARSFAAGTQFRIAVARLSCPRDTCADD